MTLDELPLMLTVDEAAEVLRIGRNSAYAAVADGAIPSVRIGRAIRIPRHSLAVILGVGEPASSDSDDAAGSITYESSRRRRREVPSGREVGERVEV